MMTDHKCEKCGESDFELQWGISTQTGYQCNHCKVYMVAYNIENDIFYAYDTAPFHLQIGEHIHEEKDDES